MCIPKYEAVTCQSTCNLLLADQLTIDHVLKGIFGVCRKEYNRRVKEVVQASWMEGTNGSAPAEEEEEEAEPAAAEDAADTGAEKEEKTATEPKDQDKDKKEDA